MIHLNKNKFTIVTNQYTSPFKNMKKSTPAIERLKADKEPKFTVCGKEFQTLMTLSLKNLLRTLQLNALNIYKDVSWFFCRTKCKEIGEL